MKKENDSDNDIRKKHMESESMEKTRTHQQDSNRGAESSTASMELSQCESILSPSKATSAQTSPSEATSAQTEGDPSAEEDDVHPAVKAVEELHKLIGEMACMLKLSEALFRQLKKDMKKACKKKRRSAASSSNLMKPVPLSPALCSLLGMPEGSAMTRGQVTSAVNEYAKNAGIKHPDNGRIIVVNSDLGGLLGLDAGTEVQIFHVQKYLKLQKHYLPLIPDPVEPV
jgi:chromatin remodeling complex protein RSC6